MFVDGRADDPQEQVYPGGLAVAGRGNDAARLISNRSRERPLTRKQTVSLHSSQIYLELIKTLRR